MTSVTLPWLVSDVMAIATILRLALTSYSAEGSFV
jgi:hypothetical protein